MLTNSLSKDADYDTIFGKQLSLVAKELSRTVDLAKRQTSSPEDLSALQRHTDHLKSLLQKANDP